ncbi:MAG: hypothetical protein ABW127_00110 [Candidatus Thiodiazotropha endolucinida]
MKFLRFKDTKWLLAFLLLFGFLIATPGSGIADTETSTPISDKFTFNGKEFSRHRVVRSFLAGAFSEHIEGSIFRIPSKQIQGPYSFLEYNRLKKEYPWFYKHLYHPDGMPRFVAINKWVEPVKISTGWPNDLKPFEPVRTVSEEHDDYALFGGAANNEGYREILENELETLLPELRRETTLDITYLPHGTETLDNYANLRIVFLKGEKDKEPTFKSGFTRSMFSGGLGRQHPITVLFRGQVEPNFISAVYFTPNTKKHVEGYFLPNHKNEIDFAVCYLMEGHEENMVRAMVRECVVRALGLPDATTIDRLPNNILSSWNDQTQWSRGSGTPQLPEEPPSLTEADKLMLHMLYLPKIRPGMSPIETQRAFLDRSLH